MLQVAHEELQPDEREHAQTEHGQDHDVRELLHRLDQGAHDGLQAWGQGIKTDIHKEIKSLNAWMQNKHKHKLS